MWNINVINMSHMKTSFGWIKTKDPRVLARHFFFLLSRSMLAPNSIFYELEVLGNKVWNKYPKTIVLVTSLHTS